jgi:hypothetical protein
MMHRVVFNIKIANIFVDEPTVVPREPAPQASQASQGADEVCSPPVEDKAAPEPMVEPESIVQEPVVAPPATVEPAIEDERLRLVPNQFQSRLQLPPLLQTPASLTTKMTPVKQSLLHQSSLRKRLSP